MSVLAKRDSCLCYLFQFILTNPPLKQNIGGEGTTPLSPYLPRKVTSFVLIFVCFFVFLSDEFSGSGSGGVEHSLERSAKSASSGVEGSSAGSGSSGAGQA